MSSLVFAAIDSAVLNFKPRDIVAIGNVQGPSWQRNLGLRHLTTNTEASKVIYQEEIRAGTSVGCALNIGFEEGSDPSDKSFLVRAKLTHKVPYSFPVVLSKFSFAHLVVEDESENLLIAEMIAAYQKAIDDFIFSAIIKHDFTEGKTRAEVMDKAKFMIAANGGAVSDSNHGDYFGLGRLPKGVFVLSGLDLEIEDSEELCDYDWIRAIVVPMVRTKLIEWVRSKTKDGKVVVPEELIKF